CTPGSGQPCQTQMIENRLCSDPRLKLGLREPRPYRAIAWRSSKRIAEIFQSPLSPTGRNLSIKKSKAACKPGTVLQQSRIFGTPRERFGVGIISRNRLFAREPPPLIQSAYRGSCRENRTMRRYTRNSTDDQQATDKKT